MAGFVWVEGERVVSKIRRSGEEEREKIVEMREEAMETREGCWRLGGIRAEEMKEFEQTVVVKRKLI